MGLFGSKATAEQMEAAKKEIEAEIAANKVVIYHKSHCPYCHKAIASFKSIGVEFLDKEISKREDCDAVQDALKDITGGRSVPRVFIDGKFIGGGDETVAFEKSGKLKELCVAAGALA
eukprot:Trichotokara_eunicae@DN3442_c0_g1_i2.p1